MCLTLYYIEIIHKKKVKTINICLICSKNLLFLSNNAAAIILEKLSFLFGTPDFQNIACEIGHK